MQASLIQPIVAFVALILQLVFCVRLAEEQLEIITNGVVATSLMVITLISAHKVYKEKQKGK